MRLLKRMLGVLAIIVFVIVTMEINATSKTLKVAAVFPGIVTDQAGMQITYEGLLKAEKAFNIETAYSEKVPQADQLEAMSDYARRGYDLIFGVGGEFTAAAKRVARQYPDSFLIVINGAPTEGCATLNYDNKQFGYVLGFTAGKWTKTGKAGIVSAQALPVVLDAIDGFKKGFERGHPGGEVYIAYTNDFDDVAKAKEAALNQIARGTDVILPFLDNGMVGVLKAAKEKDIKCEAVWANLSKHWPEQNLLCTISDFGEYLKWAVEKATKGELKRKDYINGLGTKMGYLSEFNDEVPKDLKDEVLKVIEDLNSGRLKI